MKIIVEERVDQAIDAFYDAAILSHWHTLSYETVERKRTGFTMVLSLLFIMPLFFPKPD